MYRFLFGLFLYFGFILGINLIEGGNEITTVYKFRTIKSDTEDVKYLNTCRVEVHVEDNPLQLPLFNINGDSSLPESTIPPLYTDQGTSTWQQLMQDGTTRALPAISLNKTDFSQILDMDLSGNEQIMNLCKTDIVGNKFVSYDGDVFLNLNKNDNIKTILEVSFQERKYFRVGIYWGCSYSGHTGVQVYINGNRDFVINYIDSSEFIYAPQNYATDEYGRGHIAIDLSNNVTIIDKVSLVTTEAPILAIQGCSDNYKINHYFWNERSEVMYQLIDKTYITLVSPWVDIKDNQTLFILHSRQTGSNLSVLVENKNRSGNPIQLPCEDITHVNKTDDKAIVLTKVIVTFPQNWDGQKRIKLTGDGGAIFVRNVWAGRPLDLYRVQQPQPCMISNIRDIYNTPPLSTRSQSDRMYDCFNGGRLENNFTCICPPGFIGNACEIPCDRNLFGAHCMKQCSTSPNECEGVVLCTPKYGCSCAPGYQGDYCTEKCQPGFYGADCKQHCGDCRDGCDIYTGNCLGGCSSNYFTRPQCKHSHSYLLSSGQVLGSNLNQIDLQIDFTRKNLFKSNDNTMFYMMQYREDSDLNWINGTYELFNEDISNITIEGLKPGRIYQIRTLLIDDALETHDPLLTGHTTYKIDFSKNIIGVTLSKTKSSVDIKWFPNPIYKKFFIKYKLKIHLACKKEETVFPLQVITTSQTSYSLDLNDLEAHSQYELFVTADINQNNMNSNNMSFITYSRVPNAIPTLLHEKLKIKNESAQLHWTDFSLSCEHMNGIFKSYRIELYNKQNLTEHVYLSSDSHMTITGLTPETKYDVRIRFVNQVGPSSNYLEHSFQTKPTSVFFIQDLTAYKTGPNLIGLRWKCVHNNLTNSGINIYLETVIWNKTITLSDELSTIQCKAWPGFMCFDVTELMGNTKYAIKMETFPEGSESKTIQAVTKENAPSPVSDIQADCTNTSMTVSWRIPNLLNGILRKFVIELEHLSSYDETMCCQDVLVVNFTVSTEEETYSYTLQNIKPASSYQISIRPFTKRWGSITSHFIDTPPLPIPLQMKPQFKLDNVNIQFKEEDQKTSDSGKNELISETLIIVQEINEDANVNTRHVSDRFTTDMSRVLVSNTWWLTHVCVANDDKCSVDLNVNEYQNSTVVPYFGQVVRKPLVRNHRYRIVVAQVNKYLSARSYSMKKSEYFTFE